MRFSTSNIVDANSWFRLGLSVFFYNVLHLDVVGGVLVGTSAFCCALDGGRCLGFYVRSYHDV